MKNYSHKTNTQRTRYRTPSMFRANTTFTKRTIAIVQQISKGKVMTYQQVATAAGNPRAARAVGTIMRKNINPTVPCHRVIKSNGTPGKYSRPGGSTAKLRKLQKEGVCI